MNKITRQTHRIEFSPDPREEYITVLDWRKFMNIEIKFSKGVTTKKCNNRLVLRPDGFFDIKLLRPNGDKHWLQEQPLGHAKYTRLSANKVITRLVYEIATMYDKGKIEFYEE